MARLRYGRHFSAIARTSASLGIVGRLLTGVAAGLASGTAIAYLIELRFRADPKASMVGARNIGAAITVGALGIGPLIAGGLAQWATSPLTVPYLVFLALGAVCLARMWSVPETGTRNRQAQTMNQQNSSSAVPTTATPHAPG